MFGLPILAGIEAPPGATPLLLYAGDNMPGIKPGLLLEFLPQGPRHIRVTRNDGADTVLIWDDGTINPVRFDDEPDFDASPLRPGRAACFIED